MDRFAHSHSRRVFSCNGRVRRNVPIPGADDLRHRAACTGRSKPGFQRAAGKRRKINRLPPEALDELRKRLHIEGFVLADGDNAMEELRRLRALYEPYALSLAGYLKLDLPPWMKGAIAKDNWQTTAWQLSQAQQQAIPAHDEHQ